MHFSVLTNSSGKAVWLVKEASPGTIFRDSILVRERKGGRIASDRILLPGGRVEVLERRTIQEGIDVDEEAKKRGGEPIWSEPIVLKQCPCSVPCQDFRNGVGSLCYSSTCGGYVYCTLSPSPPSPPRLPPSPPAPPLPPFYPDFHSYDPYQNFLVDEGLAGVWKQVGRKTVAPLGVTDTQVFPHRDLNVKKRVDFVDNTPNIPSYFSTNSYWHGTAVAGVAAATRNNGISVAGVSPSEIVSYNIFTSEGYVFSIDIRDSFLADSSSVPVKVNSWGFEEFSLVTPSHIVLDSLREATRSGRGGVGTILVFASGNGGEWDDVNSDALSNSIHTISVSAIDSQGRKASFSEHGSCITVSAPGVNVPSTYTSFEGEEQTVSVSGTSFAAPFVAGLASLLLSINPSLGWRDVQEILMRSADRPSSSDWTTNAAGFRYNNFLGSGIVNVSSSSLLSGTWVPLGDHLSVTEVPSSSPSNLSSGVTFSSSSSLRLEHVQIVLSTDVSPRSQLGLSLTSPSGTKSTLLRPGPFLVDSPYQDWNLTSLVFWGESSAGDWYLESDSLPSHSYLSLKLVLFGTSSAQPTSLPSAQPTSLPSAQPTSLPSAQPNSAPSTQPNSAPSTQPTSLPSAQPNSAPSTQPTSAPSTKPTSSSPSTKPTSAPSTQPTSAPSTQPTSSSPSTQPTSSSPSKEVFTLSCNEYVESIQFLKVTDKAGCRLKQEEYRAACCGRR